MSKEVYSILIDAAQRWPTLPAIIDEQGALSFAELAQEAELLRHKLIDTGIGKGAGVGIMTRNNRAFLVSLFGAIGCGAVVMPVSHQLREAEISTVMSGASLAAIIDDHSSPFVPAGASSILSLHRSEPLRITVLPGVQEQLIAAIPDAAFVRFTSGTTGRSKGVVLSARAVLERIAAAQHVLQLNPGDKITWVLPMAYHFVVSIVLYVRYGACVVTTADMLAETIVETTRRESCAVLYATPTHYRMLAAENSGRMMPSVRLAVSTSSPITQETAEAFQSRFQIRPTQVYGMIEAGLPLANKNCSTMDSLGTPVPGYEVAILDEEGHAVPRGASGQLAIRGPGMFEAYLFPFAPRSASLLHGYFPTGDFACQTEDGIFD